MNIIARGTTPVHTFPLPFGVECIDQLVILYKQGDEQVLRRTREDCTLEGSDVTTRLTQEDTFLFTPGQTAEIQMRILTEGGDVLNSFFMRASVLDCGEDVVLE